MSVPLLCQSPKKLRLNGNIKYMALRLTVCIMLEIFSGVLLHPVKQSASCLKIEALQ